MSTFLSLPIPPERSTAIREVRGMQRDDGNYGPLTFLFARGGGETHWFVLADDLHAMLEARSVGTHYWQTFRKKYKTPLRVAEVSEEIAK